MKITYAGISTYLCACLGVVGGIPFISKSIDPHDPENVALIRDALTQTGISPDGINVNSMNQKWELYRTRYTAHYRNKWGQGCFMKWHVNSFTGSPSMRRHTCVDSTSGESREQHNTKETMHPKKHRKVYAPSKKQKHQKTQKPQNHRKQRKHHRRRFLWVPFTTVKANTDDPRNVLALQTALKRVGVNTHVKLKTISKKWELLSTRYKAVYTNKKGQECFLEWRVSFFGLRTPEMPICDRVAMGGSYD